MAGRYVLAIRADSNERCKVGCAADDEGWCVLMSLADAGIAATLGLYYFSIAFVSLYGANCYLMVFLHVRSRRRMLERDREVWAAWKRPDGELPLVTVQLPLFNERYVVSRLLDAITRLDYPKDRFEIQVLDDSTDSTTEIAGALVARYRSEGFRIDLHHRTNRAGFKAGALLEGHKVARGEFIAIFDADFVPAPDFLRRTLPFFDDPKIGLVQTQWGHLNRTYSPLTIAQSVGLDGNNYVVHAARNWSGLMSQFQGTGGVWRRTAMDDAGGWHADTLTEDLDLSYRAQIKGWKMKFLPEVICPAELPVTISGAKSQQHRWAKGGLQNAYKLIPAIIRSDLPLAAKCDGVFHLVTYLIHPCVLFVALSWPLQIWFRQYTVGYANPALGVITLALCFFGPMLLFLYAQKHIYGNLRKGILYFLMLMVYATGIAVNNAKAVVEALFRIESGFVRTPKFRIEQQSDTAAGKGYRMNFGGQVIVEALISLYCLCGLAFMALRANTLVDPFLVVSTAGFCIVTGQSVLEVLSGRRRRDDDGKGEDQLLGARSAM